MKTDTRESPFCQMNYQCADCTVVCAVDAERWCCSDCGGVLDLVRDTRQLAFPTREQLAEREPTLWRYREAIAVDHAKGVVSLNEGMTPLVLDATTAFQHYYKMVF